VECFQEPAAYGGHESLRFRIDLKVEAGPIVAHAPKGTMDVAEGPCGRSDGVEP
jgi:hypothetical protein